MGVTRPRAKAPGEKRQIIYVTTNIINIHAGRGREAEGEGLIRDFQKKTRSESDKEGVSGRFRSEDGEEYDLGDSLQNHKTTLFNRSNYHKKSGIFLKK